MKKGIHPVYHTVTVKCGCGNSFETRSTYKDNVMPVEICSLCHPVYAQSRGEKGETRFGEESAAKKFEIKWSWDAQSKMLKEKLKDDIDKPTSSSWY